MSGWNPRVACCEAFITPTSILVKACFLGSDFPLSSLNYYDIYINRGLFWDSALARGLFNIPNLLIVGDLNFTLFDVEIWGSKSRMDPLLAYFS